MSTAKTDTKKRKLLDRPVLGPIIAALIIFYGAELGGGIIGGILDLVTGHVKSFDVAEFMSNGVFFLYLSALGGILMCFVFKGWFHGAYKGCFGTELGDKKTKIIILCMFALEILINIPVYILRGVNPFTLSMLGMSLMPGICEEAAFRVGIISLVMRRYDDEKAITRALVISVILFGLVHAMNLMNGQDAVNTVIQIAGAMALGFLYGVVYLRTGNVIILMVIHSLHDLLAFLQVGATENGVMVGSITGMDMAMEVGFAVICIVMGIILLKGSKDKIKEVWKAKWE